jgi:putative DNA primase/helicase
MIIDKGTSSNSSRKKQALQYARRGWLVVPMHTIKDGKCSCWKGNDCERAGKHPIAEHGVYDAITERGQIKRWWTANPNANIGIATGRKSGIIVLDEIFKRKLRAPYWEKAGRSI